LGGKKKFFKQQGDKMQTVKVMSIIGIIIFSIGFLAIVGWSPTNTTSYTAADIDNSNAAIGFGILLSIYGIAYSITCLVQSSKTKLN
jgi:hypothetical protein